MDEGKVNTKHGPPADAMEECRSVLPVIRK
jgi:hypothetical protein